MKGQFVFRESNWAFVISMNRKLILSLGTVMTDNVQLSRAAHWGRLVSVGGVCPKAKF